MTTDVRGRMQGRKVVITGAGSGIGAITAEVFLEAGAQVALIDRDQQGLARFEGQSGASCHTADITDDAALAAAIAAGAAAMGGIDGVVTAAGIMKRGSVAEVDPKEWRRVLDINLTGTYAVVHYALPWLQQAEAASIVTIGSGQALLPNVADRSAYAGSKGGVVNLTRALAAELAPKIRANCVCPGLVDTPMADGVRGNFGNYALRRLADPREIALAILFLSSSEASYITGATLAADGGRTFH